MTTQLRTILFVGGGTGGHIFPNVAVYEALLAQHVPVYGHFLLSHRPLDAQIAAKHQIDFTPVPAEGLSMRPWTWPRFYRQYRQSVEVVRNVIDKLAVAAAVATGGFVSAPAVEAAAAMNVPVAVVNLDAVPGKANRIMARKATEVFTCYPCEQLPSAQRIGLPLRQSTRARLSPQDSRQQLGLDPHRPTLLVTAGSQGASTINQMMIELVSRSKARHVLGEWQVLHLSGAADRDAVVRAYEQAKVPARVEAFCNAMGLAWGAATIAISRAGAGSVAEVWANAVPTLFYPYPFHRDQHQRLNAQSLVSGGAALLMNDLIDPIENVNRLVGPLSALMSNEAQRQKMIEAMQASRPADGAVAIATWLATAMGTRFQPTP